MSTNRSIKTVQSSTFGPFQKPCHDSYIFSKIPGTIKSLLGKPSSLALPSDVHTQKEYDTIIFFLLDGFGWSFFEKNKERYPFLSRFVENGTVSMLTSQFPSTTTAHITTLHTGLGVEKTGFYEWYMYEPLVDAPIIAMRYAFAYDKKINTLFDAGIAPKNLFPLPTFYNELQQQGIHSTLFQPKDIIFSPYSKTLQEGAETIGYKTFREGLNKLKKHYNESKHEKQYYFFYYPEIDSFSHEFGPNSKEIDKEIAHTFFELNRFFESLIKSEKKTALIVSADHGMAEVDPEKMLFLNELMPEITDSIKQNKKGEPIVPCGSSRDFFLHIKDDQLESVKKRIKELLAQKAEVYTTKELIDNGVIASPAKRFLDRAGNLVILPHAPLCIWWKDKRLPKHSCKGHHGGLSSDELFIPFLFLEI